MKTYQKSSVSKLTARFDKELKAILMNDLKTVRAMQTETLKAA